MNRVQSITDDASQEFEVVVPGGDSCSLSLWYVPLQIGWFFSLTYKGFTVACMRVTRSQNLLDQFTDLLPFGLACFTATGEEPLLQEEFAAGRAALYVLDPADLASLEAYYGS